MTAVLLLGSCATRDSFELAEAKGLRIVDYFARTSLASLATKPYENGPSVSLTSQFQQRMVNRDFEKSFWTTLETDDFDYLIIDLIDDRFSLMLFPEGHGVTASAELQKSALDFPPHKTVHTANPKFRDLWKKGARRLATTLKERGKSDRIIVNCVYYADTEGRSQHPASQKENSHLQWAYADLKIRFPLGVFVEYPANVLKSDPEHKWGPAPFHFSTDVYKHFLACVASAVDDRI